jgi:hypothetical protein
MYSVNSVSSVGQGTSFSLQSASGASCNNNNQEVFSFADATKAHCPRSFSTKRKVLEVSPNSIDKNSGIKNARLDTQHNDILSSAQENLVMLEQVANEIHDATSSDPVLVSRLCTSFSSPVSA